MRPSIAPLIWIPRSKPPTDTLGFGRLGLGEPTTLWVAEDQSLGLSPFVTRYGAAWSVVDTGAGSIDLDATGWGPNSGPVVQMAGGGTAVELGLSCPGAASNATSIQYDFTWACPIKWPAAFATAQLPFNETDGDAGASLTRLAPIQFTSATAYSIAATLEAANVAPPAASAVALPFTTTAVRYGLMVTTSQVRSGNRVWQSKVWTSGGNLNVTSGAIVSAAVCGPLDNFTMGYRVVPASFVSSDLGFGGGVRWQVGASDAQLDAILDTWANLYPL